MIWLMGILRIFLEEQPLIKFYVIKHLISLKIQNLKDINVEFASMVHKFFNKKNSDGAVKIKIMPNQQLADKLHKPIIKKFEKQKVNLSFIDKFKLK